MSKISAIASDLFDLRHRIYSLAADLAEVIDAGKWDADKSAKTAAAAAVEKIDRAGRQLESAVNLIDIANRRIRAGREQSIVNPPSEVPHGQDDELLDMLIEDPEV